MKQAVVKLEGEGVIGSVTFTRQDDGQIRVTGTVTGMPAGKYGFHIHETGDITKGCGSTGGHFNPNGVSVLYFCCSFGLRDSFFQRAGSDDIVAIASRIWIRLAQALVSRKERPVNKL